MTARRSRKLEGIVKQVLLELFRRLFQAGQHALVIQVQDAGQGIPQQQLKLIFETFYRAPDARTSSKDGWGLGLAICKDIVERHGGRIWCDSTPGKGTTFTVELPLR